MVRNRETKHASETQTGDGVGRWLSMALNNQSVTVSRLSGLLAMPADSYAKGSTSALSLAST